MLYITKIDDYLKILTDEEVKYFVAIPPSNKTSWRHRKDVSLYIPVTSWARLK